VALEQNQMTDHERWRRTKLISPFCFWLGKPEIEEALNARAIAVGRGAANGPLAAQPSDLAPQVITPSVGHSVGAEGPPDWLSRAEPGNATALPAHPTYAQQIDITGIFVKVATQSYYFVRV
jgi:hypothetical protein